MESALVGTSLSTTPTANAVVAAIVADLKANGLLIFVRKRKKNRIAHAVTPAGTGALAPCGSPYLPPPRVSLTHIQQPLHRAHCHFLHRCTRCRRPSMRNLVLVLVIPIMLTFCYRRLGIAYSCVNIPRIRHSSPSESSKVF